MPNRPRIILPPPPDHPRDLPATSVHRPPVITNTAFSQWHNRRYPDQAEAVARRLRARHLDRAEPADYRWLIGTGGVLIFDGPLGAARYGRHEIVHATTLSAGQLVLVRVELVVDPGER